MQEDDKPKRGFAAMDPDRQREIARKGGLAVPPEKRSFSTSRALAASAGSLGGKAVDPSKRSFAQNRDLAVESGRKGGAASKRPKYD